MTSSRRGDVVAPWRPRGRRRAAALVGLGIVASGCSPTYVLRAGYEEAKFLLRREPIREVLKQPALAAPTREKLELVLSVRQFAETLGLEVGGSYTTVAQVDSDQIVHLVFAAERLRLVPYDWGWYPIVGRVPYKGFFDEGDAKHEAAELEREGFDTRVSPAAAYSTLGWFDDPLPSTLLDDDSLSLAGTILHELTHSTFFAPSQATFNESFATFAGRRGAEAFFASRDGATSPTAVRAGEVWQDTKLFSVFLDAFVDRLRSAYDAGISLDERAALFTQAQDEFRQLHFSRPARGGFGEAVINNALILGLMTYHHRLSLFDDVYTCHGGDLRSTLAAIIEAAKRADDPYTAVENVAARCATSASTRN